MIRDLCLVAIGGAIGAVCRYGVSAALQHRWVTAFPLGTFVVNVVGCFLIGLLAQGYQAGYVTPTIRLLVITGGIGALTTFSTFGYETFRCYHDQSLSWSALNVLANVVVGLAAVAMGLGIGRMLWPTPS